jgi:hypothetical protein
VREKSATKFFEVEENREKKLQKIFFHQKILFCLFFSVFLMEEKKITS